MAKLLVSGNVGVLILSPEQGGMITWDDEPISSFEHHPRKILVTAEKEEETGDCYLNWMPIEGNLSENDLKTLAKMLDKGMTPEEESVRCSPSKTRQVRRSCVSIGR
jgi:hypothetical protein